MPATACAGGRFTDVCVAFVALSAREAGYEVFAVTNASGTFDLGVRTTALMRMQAAGVQLVNWFAVACELAPRLAERHRGTGRAAFEPHSEPSQPDDELLRQRTRQRLIEARDCGSAATEAPLAAPRRAGSRLDTTALCRRARVRPRHASSESAGYPSPNGRPQLAPARSWRIARVPASSGASSRRG
jgi:hypothetical protein